MAFPQEQYTSDKPVPTHRILDSKAYCDWASGEKSPIFYIQGQDADHSWFLAETVSLYRQSELQKEEKYSSWILRFTFSSRDPARASLDRMLVSFIVQWLVACEPVPVNGSFNIFLDLFKFQRGWTLKDIQNLFLLLMSPVQVSQGNRFDGFLVLHDADEWEPRSRYVLWNVIQKIADLSDSYLKVIVTSRRKLSLLADSDQASSWWLYNDDENRPALQSVYHVGSTISRQITSLIQHPTSWPGTWSPRAWLIFGAHLNRFWPSTSHAAVLDKTLRTVPDQIGLRWALTWLIYGHRPLKTFEFARLLCHCDRGKGYQYLASPIPSTSVHESLSSLKSWLSVVAEFGHERISVKASIWDIFLDEKPEYLWNEIEPVAHRTILEFLKSYLTNSGISYRLDKMYEDYIAGYDAEEDSLVPSFVPVQEGVVCYAVTAFPYHLEKYPQFLRHLKRILLAPNQPLLPWAKMYWAMSNPFARPSVKSIVSPLSVLVSRENLDPSFYKALKAIDSSVVISPGVPKAVGSLDSSSGADALSVALLVGDEDTTLEYMQNYISKITSVKQSSDGSSTASLADATDLQPLLSRALWRAAWLNMERLVKFILEIGATPDSKDFVTHWLPSPLYVASILGNKRIVEALLQAGADTRRFCMLSSGGNTNVLYTAAGYGHRETIRALVAKDEELLEMEQPRAPLWLAALYGKWQAVETLLALGARPDYDLNGDGNTPLIMASLRGNFRAVRALLENKADPNLCGPDCAGPALWYACMDGQSIPCVRTLLDYGADPNHESIESPLLSNICRSTDIAPEKKVALLEALVSNSPSVAIDKPDAEGRTGLMWAAARGEVLVVEWLFAHNADISALNVYKASPLCVAVGYGHLEVVLKLLARGAPMNNLPKKELTVLHTAMVVSVEMLIVLLNAGADPEMENNDGYTIVIQAVLSDKPEIVKLLIDRKVNLHHRDNNGWSLIHHACRTYANPEIVRLLVEAGVRLTETTTNDRTPLHFAAIRGRADIIAVLLESQGALDLEQRDSDGETPVFFAVSGGSLECVRLLLQAGANINAQRSDGWTALMVALGEGEMDLSERHALVDLLLSQPGLDVGLLSKSEGAALHYACARLDPESVTRLLRRGAEVNQEAPSLWYTPLMAACIPYVKHKLNDRDQNIDKMDKIIRSLVDRGANLRITCKTRVISNLICAVMLNSGPGTVRYLLSEGLSLEDRGALDRLPIHYAAANGIENFNVAPLNDHDLLAVDVAGKSVLHWAAQFGHVQTVEKILAYAPTDEERRKWLNHADIDGWTALCWALRPETEPCYIIISEPCHHGQTVQILLKNGANVPLNCRFGKEEERITLLELAKLHNCSDEIINLLTEANAAGSIEKEGEKENEIAPSILAYTERGYFCDICLSTIRGPVQICQSCENFTVCKKCFGHIELYHGYMNKNDGQPHTFELVEEPEPEIQEPSEVKDDDQDKGPKGDSSGYNQHDGSTVLVDDFMEAMMNIEV